MRSENSSMILLLVSIRLERCMPKIVQVEPLGQQDCFDIEVDHPDHQFYLSNGLLTSNSAHAKSYGMVTMQTAYLRTYYPLEFFSGLLSAGQAADLQSYVNDIRAQGFQVHPVDVNRSGHDFKVESGGIRLALTAVKGIGTSATQKIVAGQPYASFEDFVLDSGTSKTIVDALIWAGAFTELCPGVTVATLDARHQLLRSDKKLTHKKNRDIAVQKLLEVPSVVEDQVLCMQRERELLGYNLRGTPFSINGRYEKVDRLVSDELCSSGWTEFLEDEDQQILIAPLLVKSLEEKTQKNGKLFANMWLTDREGVERKLPCFGNVWEHVRTAVRVGEVYIILLHRKEDDPSSFIVGRPGWKHTSKSCASYFIPIDDLEV